MAKFDVISPDGFSIDRTKTWTNQQKAKDALTSWMRRFESQGYYSSNKGRIPLNELADHCEIKLLKPKDESEV